MAKKKKSETETNASPKATYDAVKKIVGDVIGNRVNVDLFNPFIQFILEDSELSLDDIERRFSENDFSKKTTVDVIKTVRRIFSDIKNSIE